MSLYIDLLFSPLVIFERDNLSHVTYIFLSNASRPLIYYIILEGDIRSGFFEMLMFNYCGRHRRCIEPIMQVIDCTH